MPGYDLGPFTCLTSYCLHSPLHLDSDTHYPALALLLYRGSVPLTCEYIQLLQSSKPILEPCVPC